MNDSRLGAFAAPHFAGYESHAASAAVAGAAVIRQIDAVAQSGIQQQLSVTHRKAIAIDRNLVTSPHCPIPLPHLRVAQMNRSRRAGDARQPSVRDLKQLPSWFGS